MTIYIYIYICVCVCVCVYSVSNIKGRRRKGMRFIFVRRSRCVGKASDTGTGYRTSVYGRYMYSLNFYFKAVFQRRDFARGATFSVRLIKKLNCFQLCCSTLVRRTNHMGS